MKIYKYAIGIVDSQTLLLPEGAKILCIQMQKNTPYIWVLCSINVSLAPRELRIYGTGNPLPEEYGKYIGTFQEGFFVWHLFEV